MNNAMREALIGCGFEQKIDRADSPEKIVPPPPLPHVSRKALKRIGGDALAIPTECRYCQGVVALVNNSEVYNGREYGDWPYLYLCRSCRAYVGLHPNTDIPLGTLANRQLRSARNSGKSIFYALKDEAKWNRNQAYKWLAEAMGLPAEQCHWGMFEIDQCKLAGRICLAEINRLKDQ